MSKVGKSVKVKEENEIQSFITSFKELEDPEDEPSTSKKVFLSSDQLESEDYDQIIVREEQDQGNEENFKYVFIVQDEEDGTEQKDVEGEIYEFDEMEEDALDDDDDKAKIVKVINSSARKGGQGSSSQGNAHMCSFCNYSTPKRYLLARHMKCHSEDR